MANVNVVVLCLSLVLACDAIRLDYDDLENVPMKRTSNLSLRLSFDDASGEELDWPTNRIAVLTFNLVDKKSWAVRVLNESITFDYNQIRKRRSVNVVLKGVIIGINTLEIFGHIEDKQTDVLGPVYLVSNTTRFVEPIVRGHVHLKQDEKTLMDQIQISVELKDKTLNKAFTIVMTIMVIVTTVNMGGQLDLEIIKDVFKKPIGPVVGFISQFVLMPMFAFGVGYLMTDDTLFRLGLFVLGCCPGGTGSNFWCILLGGDINLSITMTFVSTIAALGMMPLWMFIMGPYLTDGDLVIPYLQLIMTLIMLIAPISLGMWLRYRWPKSAYYMNKSIVPFTLVTVIFIFTVGVYINLFVFELITGRMVASGFMVAGAGYIFGATLAWIFRLKWEQIIAVSIETAFQNGQIAFILLKVSLDPPYGEMAIVAPVAQLMITGLPLWGMLFLWKGYTKCIRPKFCPNEDNAKEYQTEKLSENDSLRS